MIFVPALDAYKNTSSGRIRYLIVQITELSPISAEQVRFLVSWGYFMFYSDVFGIIFRNLSSTVFHNLERFPQYPLSLSQMFKSCSLLSRVIKSPPPPTPLPPYPQIIISPSIFIHSHPQIHNLILLDSKINPQNRQRRESAPTNQCKTRFRGPSQG